MWTYSVNDPSSYANPIPKDLRAGKLIVYHGTNAKYAGTIERDGFVPHSLPYDMDDIFQITKLFDSLGWTGEEGHYHVLRHFTLGTDNGYEKLKPVYFAFNYEKARDYATNRGGETIVTIIGALRELERYCTDKRVRAHHRKRLTYELEQMIYPPEREKLNERIAISNDSLIIKSVKAEIPRCVEKYGHIASDYIPTVYAVEVKEEWFDDKPAMFKNDLRPLIPIPPTSILARVDFPLGADRVDIDVGHYEGADELFRSGPFK